ncbi:MAG: hypothetical protein Q7R67_01870 [bacterium]|nr:hypothetical protein [bacterium]
MTNHLDYSRAYAVVNEINELIERDGDLRNLFLWRGWNLWQSYQGILWTDAKNWTLGQDQMIGSTVLFLKWVIAGIAITTISFMSAAFLVLSRRTILIYSVDKLGGAYQNDQRLEPLYEALAEKQSKYVEIFHTLSTRETVKNFIKRKRPVMYLESITFILSPIIWLYSRRAKNITSKLDCNSFIKSEVEKFIALRVISKARIILFQALFRISGVKLIFAIDDVRHYSELMTAAQLSGIPSYGIQHGHFTKYHTGWLRANDIPGEIMRPRALLVWSEYWKRELLRLGTYFKPEEIIVGGNLPKVEIVEAKDPKISILIPYEADAPKEEVRRYIEEIVKNSDARVILKLRPDHDEKKQMDAYGLKSGERIIAMKSTKEALENSSLALGTYSSLLYDCVAHMIPVGILITSLDYGEGMVTNGLADFVKNIDSINKLALTSKETLVSRRKKLLGDNDKELAGSIRDIIKQHVPV